MFDVCLGPHVSMEWFDENHHLIKQKKENILIICEGNHF